jgi:cytochrome P450
VSVLATVEKPAHVAAQLVVDFDFMRPGPEGCDPFEAWSRLHGLPPLVWTPRNGGHWLATRGEDIPAILKNYELFSSRRAFIGMADRPRAVPLEYDPPEHGRLRKVLLPAFTPKAIAAWSVAARRLAIELIEGFRADGRCEFMHDFAQQLPMIIFLRMVELPLEHRAMLIDWSAPVCARPMRPGASRRALASTPTSRTCSRSVSPIPARICSAWRSRPMSAAGA